ncbi:TPA: hypothetical protein VAM13_000114 [Acinetobacter baumannii]|nr:hypothetical protein [Acinetobacter baumannii]
MDKCREEFEKWLDDNNMFMNIERRFDQESNTYDYCAIRWIWESWQHQQAKVGELENDTSLMLASHKRMSIGLLQQQDKIEKLTKERDELQRQLSEYIFVAETLDEMYVKEVKSSEELQKRVDALEKAEFTLARIRSIVSKNLLESILIREVRQALKGEGQ